MDIKFIESKKKQIQFREHDTFPLNGSEIREICEKFGTLFVLAVKKKDEYKLWINLPENKQLKENVDKLIQWSGIPQ